MNGKSPYKKLLFSGLMLAVVWVLLSWTASAPAYSQTKKSTKKKAATYSGKQKKNYLKRKNKSPLQKYFHHKQSKFTGTISVNPKPKGFSGPAGGIEHSPGRKNARYYKSRKSYFRASSNRQQRSFGTVPVHRANMAMGQKRRSRKMQKNSGNIPIRPASKLRNYNEVKARTEPHPNKTQARIHRAKQSVERSKSSHAQRYSGNINTFKNKQNLQTRYKSKTQQKAAGNLKVKPKAKQRNYDEIRARTGANPNRIEKRVQKKKESDMHSASAVAGKYQGNIKWQKNKQKLNTQYRSKAIQQARGNLRPAPQVAPSMAQKYQGGIKWQKNKQKLNAKYRSKAVQQASGTLRPALQVAPTMAQKYQGNIKWQKNKQKLNAQYRSKAVQQSRGNLRPALAVAPTMAQKYQGNIKWYKNKQKLNEQYRSKAVQQARGNLRPVPAASPTLAQKYQGNIRWQKNKQKLNTQYRSKVVQQARGNLRVSPAPSATVAQKYQGDIPWHKNKQKFNEQYRSKVVQQSPGLIRQSGIKKQNNQRDKNARLVANATGDIKIYSRWLQNRYYKRDSRTSTGGYEGNLKIGSRKKRMQEEEGKSLNTSQYAGNIRIYKQGIRKRNMEEKSLKTSNYSGNLALKSVRRQKQMEESKSMETSVAEGDVPVYSKWYQNWWMKRDSKMISSYKGMFLVKSERARKQELEGKSLNVSQYIGNARIRKPWYQRKYDRDISDRNQMTINNFRVKSKYYRALQEQVLSARVQNWEGGYKTAMITRLWLRLFDKDSSRQKKNDNTVKKPRYDTREAEIWWY